MAGIVLGVNMNNIEVIENDGNKYWHLNGQLHRIDGPAIEHANGTKDWYKHGKLHREDGPALEHNGTKIWYLNGRLHRVDGPAIEYTDGDKYWYLYDKIYSFSEWCKRTNKSKEEIVELALIYG